MDGYKKLVVISFLTLFSGSSLHAMSSQERTAAAQKRLAKKVNKTTSQADNTQQAKTPETPDVKNTQDAATPKSTTLQIKDFEALQKKAEDILQSLPAKQTPTSPSSVSLDLSSLETTYFKGKIAAAAAALKSLTFKEDNLEKAVTNLIEENSNQETILRSKQKELQKLQEENATLTFLKQSAEERAAEWKTRYKKMQGVDIVERAELQAAMAAEAMQLANDIRQYSDDVEAKSYALATKVTKQEATITQLESKGGLLSLQVKHLEEKQKNAHKQITAQKTTIEQHERVITWGKQELKKTEQERDRAQATAEDALNTLRIGKELLDEAQVKVAKREQELIRDKMRAYVALDCAQIKATNDQQKLTVENSAIKEQLRQTFAGIEELEKKLVALQQLQSTCGKIEQGIKKKDETITSLRARLDSQNDQFSEIHDNLQREIIEREERISELEIEVTTLEERVHEAQDGSSEMRALLHTKGEELITKMNEVDEAQNTISELCKLNTEAQSLQQTTARQAAEQKQALEDANRQLQKDKTDIEKHLTDAGSAIDQLQVSLTSVINSSNVCIQRKQQRINEKNNEITRKDVQLNRPFNRFGNNLQEFYERAALFAQNNRKQLVVGGAVGAGLLTYAALWHYNRAPLQKAITSAIATHISPFTVPYTKPVADFCAQNISTPLTQGLGNVSTFMGSLSASVKNNSYTLLNTVFPLQTT